MKKHTSKLTWDTPNTQAKIKKNKRNMGETFPVANVPPNALMDSVTTAPSNELPVQAKLTIGQVGDQYEQEADAVAAKVVQQINTPSSDAAQAKKEESVQLKPTVQRQDLGGGMATPELEAEINQAKGGGQSLDKSLQRSMGNAMGMDLSHVKVHTDNTSHQLNQALQAKAFTTGQDVFFGKRQYQPGSKSGQELIAHELTHVGQQTGPSIQRFPFPWNKKKKDPDQEKLDVMDQSYGFSLGSKDFMNNKELRDDNSKEAREERLKRREFVGKFCKRRELYTNNLTYGLLHEAGQANFSESNVEFMRDYFLRQQTAQEFYDHYIAGFKTSFSDKQKVNIYSNVEKTLPENGIVQTYEQLKEVMKSVGKDVYDEIIMGMHALSSKKFYNHLFIISNELGYTE
ncbi:MAG: DUF4157 domain-containing protein [Spirulina sp. SIO3F2]|nr:DUF4157 domain-containing protein [Spirulina sp. SIO3F2]